MPKNFQELVPIAAPGGRHTVSSNDERIRLTAIVIRPDGSELITATELSPPGAFDGERKSALEAAEALGRKTAESLLRKGADRILREVLRDGTASPIPQTP